MAAQKNEINKSEEIRAIFHTEPKTPAAEVVSMLAARGITVTKSHVYVVRQKMRATRRRAKVAKVAAVQSSSNGDALTTIRKIRSLATDVGGLGKLKALVEALS